MAQYIDALIPGVVGLFALFAPRAALTKAGGTKGEQVVRRARVAGALLLMAAVLIAMSEFGG